MDALHEPVKVNPLLALHRKMFKKQVHQPGFAAPDATPDIQAANWPGSGTPNPVNQGWPALFS